MRKILIIFCFALMVFGLISTACVNEQSVKYTRYFADGAQLYKNNCQNCHGNKGEGLAQLIPPLTDTLFLRKNRSILPCMLQYGISGNIKIHEKIYNFKMPANNKLASIDLAKLLTFVSNSFGNHQGIFEVSEIEYHLKNCK